MNKIILLVLLMAIVFVSCTKDNKCLYNDSTLVAPQTEIDNLRDSLTAHGITATLHPSGFYYNIEKQGSGGVVSNLCTTVFVDYKGSLLNGNIFDSTVTNNPTYFQLGQVIVGWQKGIPLLNKDGVINLFIPPTLGYGYKDVKNPQTGQVIIPSGSNLVFHVHVADIQ
ncbi:MAG: FKBP-type peptidyl-prolyl cis-trans isomerase [Bacteroidetes bacterium]|nr:FKBP-type peptidyl-prolyl cis-trans isomerase [Bacteroidota bacterium]